MKNKQITRHQIISILLLFCMGVVLCACGSKKEKLRMGTGGTGGNYYSYGHNLAKSTGEEDISIEVRETAGSAANLRLLSQDYLDLALVQSDVLYDAIHGEGLFEGNALSGFHPLTGLYSESCQIVVAADSDIESVADLKGRKVSVGEENSGAYANALVILKAYGISENMLSASYYSYADAAKALAEGEIDAFFCTASIPTTAVLALGETQEIRLLNIDYSKVNSSGKEEGAYAEYTIPAGTYAGQKEEVHTVCVTAVLVVNDRMDEETEAKLLEILEKQNEELMQVSFGVPMKEEKSGIRKLSLNMYLTLTLAVLVLYLGMSLRKRIKFLETFCIPAPVIGGLIFAVLSCVLYVTGVVEFSFDETIKNICMIMFFTSVGFQANLKVLKSGGISLLIFLGCVVALIFCQNGIAVGLSGVLNVSAFVGLCTGSIPMVGGHGTAGAFGLVLEDLGQGGATTLCTAAATFGLVMGSLMGGPIGRRLILKHSLLKTASVGDDSILVEDEKKHHRSVSMYAPAAYQLAIAMGIGTIVSELLSKTGMTFPVYIGAMIVAAFMRNVGEYSGKFRIHMGEINDIGGICLSLFLGIAMVTLKLWQLAELALPLFILLLTQTLFMALFAYFVVYNVMGRNYDAAILSAGTCGFGMGATPNAMANMQALTEKFAPSVQAYLLVPIVGSMFADFINSLVITFFINIV